MNIFAKIDVGLEGNDLPTKLTEQAGNLKSVADTVGGLIEHPPQSLGDLGAALNQLPLPKMGISGDFASALSAVRAAVPSDVTSVTGGMLKGLSNIGEQVERDLAGPLKDALDAVSAVYRLTQIDWTCSKNNGAAPPPPAASGEGAALSSGGSGTASSGGAGTGSGAGTGGGGTVGGGGTPSSGGTATSTGAGSATPAAGRGQAGVPPAVAAHLSGLQALLDAAPSPLDVEAALQWAHDASPLLNRNLFVPLSLPMVDEWLDPLQTLVAWKAMQPADIRDDMSATLESLASLIRGALGGPLGAVEADLASAAARLHADALGQIATDITDSLAQLRAAVTAGDLAGTGPAVAKINQRLDEYDALRAQIQAEWSGLPQALRRLESLPDDLADRMSLILGVAQPSGLMKTFEQVTPAAPFSHQDLRAEIDARMKPVIDWINALMDKLDLAAIQEPLKTAAQSIRGAVDALDEGMADVAVQVRALFAKVEELLDKVDTKALTDEVEQAIQNFGASLKQQIGKLFTPVSEALNQVVTDLGAAVDKFNPEAIRGALTSAIQSLAGVLKEAQADVQKIADTVENAVGQLKQFSFAPLTDEVIAAIGEITEVLQKIDTSKLNGALQLALQAAVKVLPSADDLKVNYTDKFVVEFGETVVDKPVKLLDGVKGQPAKLLDKVKSYEPSKLVGDAISKPYNGLLEKMNAFQPSKLLEPVDQEFDKLKQRLRKEANPGAPLQLLEGPFNELMRSLDQFQPDELVKPLENEVKTIIDKIVEAIRLDEVFAKVDAALSSVQQVVATAGQAEAVLGKLRSLLDGFANSQAQVDAWVKAILDKIAAMDAGPLAPRFAEVAAALDEVKAGPLAARFQAAASPVSGPLATLAPHAKLTALVRTHGFFPKDTLEALQPDSSEKAEILKVLNRFDPVDAAFSAPYQMLDSLAQGLEAARSKLVTEFEGWDERYHGSGGALASLRVPSPDAVAIRQWISEAVEPQFVRPAKLLFGLAEMLGAPLGALAGLVENVIHTVETKVANLVLGPDSVGGILDAVQELIQRLRDFKLDFLRDSIRQAFQQVKDKIAPFNPANLRQAVEKAFDDMLATLSVSQVLPQETIANIDKAYDGVITKLQGLDPGKLVAETAKIFTDSLQELIDAFDLSKIFEALLDLLKELQAELQKQMNRVVAAYGTMLDAVPPMDLSVSIDVGISL